MLFLDTFSAFICFRFLNCEDFSALSAFISNTLKYISLMILAYFYLSIIFNAGLLLLQCGISTFTHVKGSE